jgi:hypothetical protein
MSEAGTSVEGLVLGRTALTVLYRNRSWRTGIDGGVTGQVGTHGELGAHIGVEGCTWVIRAAMMLRR